MKVYPRKTFFLNFQFSTFWMLFIALCTVTCTSCKSDKKRIEAKQFDAGWMGKTVHFPNNIQCTILGKDTCSTLCSGLIEAEYKVLFYVDSTGCSSCRLKLYQWKRLMEEAESVFKRKLSFLFYFQPKRANLNELELLFRKNNFEYPVFVDEDNQLDRLNHFLVKMEYQCFLLNKQNKVVAIGNPANDSIIWKRFKQIVFQELDGEDPVLTQIRIEPIQLHMGIIQLGEEGKSRFLLKNIGKKPLFIQSVVGSSKSISIEYNHRLIEPNSTSEISVKIKGERPGLFHKSLKVYCNTPEGTHTLSINGAFVEY